MPRQVETRPPGRGKGLSRQVVAAAAVALVEADGIEALSMRRVAATLGVEAMSLYGHVASKHDLMLAMNDLVLDGVGAASRSTGDPLEDAVAFAQEVRSALVRRPNTARLFAMNMSLQDSFATQALTAKTLDIVGRLGLDVESTVYTFGFCLSFAIGAVLLEVAIVQSGGPGLDVYNPALAFDTGIRRLLQDVRGQPT